MSNAGCITVNAVPFKSCWPALDAHTTFAEPRTHFEYAKPASGSCPVPDALDASRQPIVCRAVLRHCQRCDGHQGPEVGVGFTRCRRLLALALLHRRLNLGHQLLRCFRGRKRERLFAHCRRLARRNDISGAEVNRCSRSRIRRGGECRQIGAAAPTRRLTRVARRLYPLNRRPWPGHIRRSHKMCGQLFSARRTVGSKSRRDRGREQTQRRKRDHDGHPLHDVRVTNIVTPRRTMARFRIPMPPYAFRLDSTFTDTQ